MTGASNSAVSRFASSGGRLARWLGAKVDALIGDIANAKRVPQASGVVAEVEDHGISIFGPARAGGRKLLARSDSAGNGLRAAVRKAGRGGIALRISGGKSIIKPLALPAGALDVLPAIIRNKVESLAPWPLAEVCWGYRIASPAAAGQLEVDVAMVSRKTAESQLAALRSAGARRLSLAIGGIENGEGAILINVDGAGRAAALRRRFMALAIAAIFIAAAIAAYGTFRYASNIARDTALRQRIAAVQAELRGKGQGAAASPQLAAANLAWERKKAELPVVALLDSLTRLVPDGVWLTAIDYDAGKLLVTGRGQEVSGVVERLEASPEFAAANFASATQRDAEAGLEVFSVSAVVERKAIAP